MCGGADQKLLIRYIVKYGDIVGCGGTKNHVVKDGDATWVGTQASATEQVEMAAKERKERRRRVLPGIS